MMKLGKPYREMATTCKTRPTKEKRVVWHGFESEVFEHGRFQVKLLSEEFMESAARLWQSSYPELYGSPHEFLFVPERYPAHFALEESWDEDHDRKVHCMPVVVELEHDKVVSATVLTKYERNLQVEFSFAATLPDYRLKNITDNLRQITGRTALASGAEYFTTFLETWHDITQQWVINYGWQIAGIFPGNFVRWKDPDQEYRACTVHAYFFANEGEKFATRPEEWSLAPEVREIWETLERVNKKISGKGTIPSWLKGS
jgi:hypothetical protein